MKTVEFVEFKGKRSGACLLAGAGPSLRLLDVEAFRREGLPVVAVNAAGTFFPQVDAWLSTEPTVELLRDVTADAKFVAGWAVVRGEPLKNVLLREGIESPVWFQTALNDVTDYALAYNSVGGSGMCGIHLAAWLGFKTVFMIGFDFGAGGAQYFDSQNYVIPYMKDYYASMAAGNGKLALTAQERYGMRYVNMSFQSQFNQAGVETARLPDAWRKSGLKVQADLAGYEPPVCWVMPGRGVCSQGINWKNSCQEGKCRHMKPLGWKFEALETPEEPKEAGPGDVEKWLGRSLSSAPVAKKISPPVEKPMRVKKFKKEANV